MKRKTSTIPTRVYSYGCLAPTAGADLVDEQIRLAHRYRNRLTEIERKRRDIIQEAQRLVGDIGPLAAVCDRLDAEVGTAIAAVKAKRAGAGKRVDVKEESLAVRALRQKLKDARAALKAEKQRQKEDPTLKIYYAWADAEARAAIRQARGASGLRHGNYSWVEESAEQARKESWPDPPRFLRYTGEGVVRAQLTGDILTDDGAVANRGLLVSEIASDTRVQIDPVPDDTYQRRRHHRRIASRTKVRIRVGSNADRSPVWAEFPVIIHRPLPADGVIKWTWVQRRKVGLRFEYKLNVALESETFRTPSQPCGKGTVAVDLGWRNLLDDKCEPTGEIRVAYLLDDGGHEEQVLVPAKVPTGLAKVDDLRSIRDKNFDAARALLLSWLGEVHVETTSTSSAWTVALGVAVRARTLRSLAQWRAIGKLAGFVNAWERDRFPNDEAIMVTLQTWAKQDRHLLAWEASQRDRRINHRREEYRKLAARLARAYATIVLEKFDLTAPEVNEKKPTEEGIPSDGKNQRSTKRIAAPGELRDGIKKAAAKYGARIVEVDPAYSTQTCADCGACEEWDAAPSVMNTCVACGATWDQDANACRNLLTYARNASGGVASKDGEVFAGERDSDSAEQGGESAGMMAKPPSDE